MEQFISMLLLSRQKTTRSPSHYSRWPRSLSVLHGSHDYGREGLMRATGTIASDAGGAHPPQLRQLFTAARQPWAVPIAAVTVTIRV